MSRIITFQQAIANSQVYNKRHLLVGNGFSIACVPTIFTYQSLYNEADFSSSPHLKEVFESLKTTDFELVINSLEKTASLMEVYKPTERKLITQLRQDALLIKELLINTIADNHPSGPQDIPDYKFVACRNFLSNFYLTGGNVYSLNYDLLLYWTLMHDIEDENLTLNPCDGFGRDTFMSNGEFETSEYVTWQGTSNARNQTTFYLHGALHLFEDGADLKKYTWIDTGRPLVDQTRDALNNNKFPLFVAEGDSIKKMTNITHSAYLYHNFKSFYGVCSNSSRGKAPNTCLFTYGVSFSENDEHIINKIGHGTIKHLFVGIYGDLNSDTNKGIQKKIDQLNEMRSDKFPLSISYYDVESANVWSGR